MKMKTKGITKGAINSVFVSLISICAPVLAQQHDNPSVYVDRQAFSSGWVNIHTPEAGLYVYGDEPKSRTKTPVFAIGKTGRTDYDFFSYQEEEALWLLREDMLSAEETRLLNLRRAERKRLTKRTESIPWPKVVVTGNQVCVPVLESANAPDWKDHLTCTEVPGNE